MANPQSASGDTPKASSVRRGNPTTYWHRNRRVYVPDGYLAVGQVSGVHGLKGEIKIELHSDNPNRFAAGAELLLGEDLRPVRIVQARPHKQQMLVLLAGIDRREQAETLRGQWLYIHESDAAELDEDTYWIHDIVGLTVKNADGQRLGVIREVLNTGANDVYVVETEPDVNRGRELLLPAVAEVVQKVDLDSGEMVVELLPGLMDEQPSDPEPDV
jgi:16S rRNA processing protein RimM